MQKTIFLVDNRKLKKAKRLEQLYLTAAQIAVRYGHTGNCQVDYNFNNVKEFWKFNDNYPQAYAFDSCIKNSIVKWYINEKLQIDHEIWNADFINGLATHGTLRFSKRQYPTLTWYHNTEIGDILKTSPFGGKIVSSQCSKNIIGKWVHVPAFYLRHSRGSASFVAGLMAGAKLFKFNDKYYARFRGCMKKWIEELKIPIETFSPNGIYFLISPIWPALFTPKMPDIVRNKWLEIERPYNADVYAPILWRTHINRQIKTKGIPYLKSERMVKYQFACEEGPMKKIEKLRVEKGLTELDNRIIDMVRLWSKRNEHEVPNIISKV